jgi:hypothetical protein
LFPMLKLKIAVEFSTKLVQFFIIQKIDRPFNSQK